VTHNLTGYEKLFTNPKLELVTKAIAIQLAIQDDSKMKDASKWLNDIWIKKSELKNNKLFKKYIEKIIVMVPIAPGITYQTYLNIDALGLIYVEVLQQIKQPKLAKSIIEGVGANQVTAISLAELEIQLGEYDDVLALTNDLQNKDDATAILLVFRGIALREQKHYSASREVLNQALKSKKRNIDILHKALFERSKTYSEEGKTSKARTDLEKILKTDSDYPGLKSALAKLK
jgi:tetratricopeptide (TPR) repeat protein